jgi:hypothetical protein
VEAYRVSGTVITEVTSNRACKIKEVQLFLQQAMEAHRVVRETSRLSRFLDNRFTDGGEVQNVQLFDM